MSFSSIKIAAQNGVAEIALARPEKMNAMTSEFFIELPRAMAKLEESGETRAVLIYGEGKHFCSGMDLSFFAGEMLDTGNPLDRERFRRAVLVLQQAFSCLEKSRIPVIAAIHGACVGGALDFISACDLRYATRDAFFCIQEINLGIMADLGTLQRLPKIMPEAIVRELAYTGERLDADRAFQAHLLNSIFDTQEELLAHSRSVARRIADRSPLAIAATKEAITFARDHSVDEALYQAANWQTAIFDKKQILEAIEAQKKRVAVDYNNLRPAALI